MYLAVSFHFSVFFIFFMPTLDFYYINKMKKYIEFNLSSFNFSFCFVNTSNCCLYPRLCFSVTWRRAAAAVGDWPKGPQDPQSGVRPHQEGRGGNLDQPAGSAGRDFIGSGCCEEGGR